MGIPEAIVVLLIALPILGVVYAVRAFLRTLQPNVEHGVPRMSVTSDDDVATKTALLLPRGRIGAGMVLSSRYEIRRLIGSGGMGAVYEARDQELDSPVAIKVIRPDIAADSARAAVLTRRLRQELQLARRVTHFNVLRIHDIGEADGVRFITMPYVDGRDLGAVVHDAPLSVERAIHLGRQIVRGLAAAHDADVFHRDLKPQNILVDGNDHIYISDFGLAKCADHETDLTRTGEVHCTPRYAAPEQLEGKPADHRSDVYALGLMLYEMFTGAFPFPGASPSELLVARLTSVPKEPQSLNARIPRAVSVMVMRCLQRDPNLRYQSAREVLLDIEAETPL